MAIFDKKVKEAKETKEANDLVSLLEERVEQGKNQINNAQNYINLAYYLGKQWIHWDAVNKKVYEASNDGRTHFVANRIQKIVRTELAKIVKNKPIMACVPASNEEDDIRASKVGDKVLEYLEYKHKLHHAVDKKVIMWGLTTEIGYVHPYWDPSKGDAVTSEDGESVTLGEECFDVLSAFDVIIDPDAKEWDEVQFFIKPKARTTKYIKDKYGKDVAPDGNVEFNDGVSRQLDSLYQKYGQTISRTKKDKVTVYECWEAPSKDHPKGRRWAVAGGELLYSVNDIGFGEEDDTPRELPLFPFIHIEVPGRIQGQSVIETLIPLQREYNRARSQIIDNKDLMSNPMWIVAEGSVEDVEDIPNYAGGILTYNSGFPPPQRDQPPSLGGDVYKNLEQLQEEFYFISGQQEVSHGSTPAGVTSGVAISYLQEQDNTVLGPSISNFIYCKQGYMSYALKMLKFKYDYPRKLKIVGDSNQVNLLEFIGSDLTSTDVRIQEGTMYQDSKPAKQQWIMNLIQAGVLNPQTDRDMIVRMLEIGMVDEMYDQSQIDIDQARKEQMYWEKKAFDETIVRDFYNHDVHLMEHDRFRKSDIYEDMTPEEQSQVDSHILEHQVFQMEMQMPTLMGGGMPGADSMSSMPVGVESPTGTDLKGLV